MLSFVSIMFVCFFFSMLKTEKSCQIPEMVRGSQGRGQAESLGVGGSSGVDPAQRRLLAVDSEMDPELHLV